MEKGANKYLPSERITARKICSLRRILRRDSSRAATLAQEIEQLQSTLRHKVNNRCTKCNCLISPSEKLCVACGWYA
jgi:uncharacterized protein YlxW (UPF0749 family)